MQNLPKQLKQQSKPEQNVWAEKVCPDGENYLQLK